jgi:hypothetical protein
LGLKSPLMDLPPFFMPLPIFLSMIEADDAVEDIDRLSVEPETHPVQSRCRHRYPRPLALQQWPPVQHLPRSDLRACLS